jgi:hypothetical protein
LFIEIVIISSAPGIPRTGVDSAGFGIGDVPLFFDDIWIVDVPMDFDVFGIVDVPTDFNSFGVDGVSNVLS